MATATRAATGTRAENGLHFEQRERFAVPPEDIWPFLSDTKRMNRAVGLPPMHYLTQWRMQIAANLLAQSGAKIAAIGAEVGYDSEAAFSRAFKKATGLAPGAWRDARRATRS